MSHATWDRMTEEYRFADNPAKPRDGEVGHQMNLPSVPGPSWHSFTPKVYLASIAWAKFIRTAKPWVFVPPKPYKFPKLGELDADARAFKKDYRALVAYGRVPCPVKDTHKSKCKCKLTYQGTGRYAEDGYGSYDREILEPVGIPCKRHKEITNEDAT